jgi:predicted Zn-dependent peptidase
MCADEKYGLCKYGTREQIETLTGDRILKAWQNMLKTAVIQIDMVTSGVSDSIADDLCKQFAKTQRSPVDIKTTFIKAATQQQRESEELPVKQGKLVLGFRAGMEDARDNVTAVKVMADIFGGGTYSKLFTNVREKMSLCYYCSARLVRHKGVMFVQSGIESEKAQAVEDAVLEQLSAVKAGDFEEADLIASKLSITDSLRSLEDSPEAMMTWHVIQILESEFKTPEQELELINRVTKDEVIAVANRVTLDTVYMLSGTGEEQTDEN